MDFDKIFPLMDLSRKYHFQDCLTLKDFLLKSVDFYFEPGSANDQRLQESCLSVYMAIRDHYPGYMKYLDQEQKEN